MKSLWSNAVHLLAAVFSVLTMVNDLQLPAAITSQIPHADLYLGLIGLIVTGAHKARQLVQQDKAQAASASVPKALLPFVLVLLAVPMLNGCALFASPVFDAALQAVIDAAVAAFLAKNPGAAPLVATEATALEQLASGNSAPLAQLQQQADALVSASTLPVGDKAAFETLIALFAGPNGLIAEGQGALSQSTASVPLALVFGDIANAAGLYGPAQAKAAGLVLAKPMR